MNNPKAHYKTGEKKNKKYVILFDLTVYVVGIVIILLPILNSGINIFSFFNAIIELSTNNYFLFLNLRILFLILLVIHSIIIALFLLKKYFLNLKISE